VLVAPAGFSPRSKLIREPVARLAPAALAGRRVLGTPLMGSGLPGGSCSGERSPLRKTYRPRTPG
jgi:hypothetical protein